MAVTVNEGTQTDIYSVANAGTEIQVIKLDVGAGTTISDFGGTVRDVANITKGTVTKLEGGTVNVNMLSGTLNVGTVANAGTVVEVNKGTINLGTVAVSNTPNIGTVINVATGTINVGTTTSTVGTIPGIGTLTNVGSLTNFGTGKEITNIVGGTIGSVLGIGGTVQVSGASAGTYVNIVTGSQQTLGTVGSILGVGGTSVVNVNTGTINVGTAVVSGNVGVSSGTINVGTATVSGNVGVSTGTITTGSITNVASLHTGTITTGSITNVAMVHAGTYVHPTGTVTTIVAGTQNTLGTVAVINSQVAGTINTLGTVGVVNSQVAGTMNTLGTVGSVLGLGGTVTTNQLAIGTSFIVNGTTGAAVWGTIIAASGAGTKQYVSGVDVVVSSGTVEVAVTNIGVGGSSGAGVLARGVFIAGGGISKSYYPVIASGTNGTLSYWLGGAGTANITIQYWQGV